MNQVYEYTVKTIEVPWQLNAPWPYLPAQNAIVAAMNELGKDGWQIIERQWATTRPKNDSVPWPVNLWAYRLVSEDATQAESNTAGVALPAVP